MKRSILSIILIILITSMYITIFPSKVKADSYSIENMDIQATINKDGSVSIVQTLKYNFNGAYNGIYITIPLSQEDDESKNVVKGSRIQDYLYEGDDVEVESIKVLKSSGSSGDINFTVNNKARNGDSGVYTKTEENRKITIKAYYPVSNTSETFELRYTIKNICVKHNDVGEFYYNFIGGEWETTINNLNIDIYLPNNNNEINIWGHGPSNGTSKIISNNHASFKVSDVKPGQYVAARLIFDLSNIEEAVKYSRINAKEIIFQNEKDIYDNVEAKNRITRNILLISIGLIIYWIVLLLIYEKDKKYKVSNINEEELFKKYNPLIAGCIEGNRDILSRDIIAVILNLINKGNIKLTLAGELEKQSFYKYIIEKVPEKEAEMDSIERYIYNWLFTKDKEVLENRLKDMPREGNANQRFEILDKLANRDLNKIGANNVSVPKAIRVINIFLLIGAIILAIYHITTIVEKETFEILSIIGPMLIIIIPLLLTIILNVVIKLRHVITKNVQKINGKKIVTTSVSIIVFTIIIMAITYWVFKEPRLIVDELLISVAALIVITDNLMLKNSIKMIEDYSRLTSLKEKLENTLLDEKDIEHIYLWNEYLAYAVSFGIGEKIIKKMKNIYLDDDLLNYIVKNNDLLDLILSDYYIFYTYASLDRIFLKRYNKFVSDSAKSLASSAGDSFSRRRGRIFWRWRLLRRRRKRRRRRSFLGPNF